jgi:hypothetical protein
MDSMILFRANQSWLWIALGAIAFTVFMFGYHGRGDYTLAGALVSIGDDPKIAVRGQLYEGKDLSASSQGYMESLVATVSDSAVITRTIIDGSAAKVGEGTYFFSDDTPSVTSASSLDQLRANWIERSTSQSHDFGTSIGVTVKLTRSWFVFWTGVEIHYSYPSSTI